MLIAGKTHLSDLSVSKQKLSKASADLQRTVHQLQSTVEALQRRGAETVSVSKRIESINGLVHSRTGRLRDAVAAACRQAVAWSV